MKPLPVLIKNNYIKVAIVLGFMLPLVILDFLGRRSDIVDDRFLYPLLLYFSGSMVLFPLTGILRDLVNILPKNTIFNLSQQVAKHPVDLEKSLSSTNLSPQEVKQKKSAVYSLFSFSIITALEFISFSMGLVIVIALILGIISKLF